MPVHYPIPLPLLCLTYYCASDNMVLVVCPAHEDIPMHVRDNWCFITQYKHYGIISNEQDYLAARNEALKLATSIINEEV